ncbi:Beta-lactamase-like precursor [uncultured Candidatus Thioglobus sp.]|nr:Beta-lactamase-like precursor [uncultured Candidatus Thioglobus sp.]
MRKITFLLTLVLSSLANAWMIDEIGDFKFEMLNNNLYIMHGPKGEPSKQNQGFMNNPGIILGDNGIIVIDPGSTYQVGQKVIKEIEKISKKPIVAVFNTHVHGDHWLGNQAIVEKYPTVKIYAHPNMITRVKEGAGEFWTQLMQDLTEGLSKGTNATYPTDSTTHLQIISIDSERFKIHNPTQKAHTDTDIMIEHINSKTLFLGDNDFIHRQGRFDNTSDMHGNIKTLEYAIDLGLNHYVPGHGASGNVETAVKPFLDYLLTIQSEVKKGYAEDLADYEIKPIAHKKLTNYHDWHGYDAQLGKHISKMLLEIEALDF